MFYKMNILIKYLITKRNYFFYFTCALLFFISISISLPKFSGKLNGFNIENNPFFKTKSKLDSLFGRKNKVILIIKPKSSNRTQVFNECIKITNEINKIYPEVKVLSPYTFYRKMPEYFLNSDKTISTFLKTAKKTPLLCDIISSDCQSFLIIVEFKNNAIPEIDKLDSLIALPRTCFKDIDVLSLYHLESNIEKYIRTDCLKISLAILIFFLAFYLYVFRKFSAIVYTAIIIGVSIFTSVFFFSFFDYEITIISVLVIPIVLVLSLSDALHLLTGYIHIGYIVDKRERLYAAVKKYIIPSFFSSATTAAAFFSFYLFNDSEYIKEFGLITAVSLMAEFFLSFMISPFLLSFVNIKEIREYKITNFANFFDKQKKYFSIGFLVLLVASFFIAPKLIFKTNSDLFFPTGSDIEKTHNEFTKQFYSQINLEIIISNRALKSEIPINHPNLLREYVKKLSDRLRLEKKVVSLTSATDEFYIKSAFIDKVNIFDELGDQNPYFNESNNLYRLEVRFKSAEMAMDFIENEFQTILIKTPPSIKTEYSSTVLLMNEINKSVSSSLVNSILTSGLAILFLIFIMTRSLSLSLLSLIPNLVPLSIVVLLYYICGLNINILTAITAVVCLGLLDDDTIHILYRRLWLKEELNELSVSILSSAFILIVGFGLFCISSFVPTRVFGLVSSLVFLLGVISEITLMQWLIEVWKKFNGNRK